MRVAILLLFSSLFVSCDRHYHYRGINQQNFRSGFEKAFDAYRMDNGLEAYNDLFTFVIASGIDLRVLPYERGLFHFLQASRYLENGVYFNARQHYVLAKECFETVQGSGQHIALSLQHIGKASLAEGKYNLALDYLWQADTLFAEQDDQWGSLETKTDIGAVYIQMGQWEDACTYYQRALDFVDQSPSLGDRANLASIHYHMALAQYELKNAAAVSLHLETGMKKAREQDYRQKANIDRLYARFAEEQGSPDKTITHYKRMFENGISFHTLIKEENLRLGHELVSINEGIAYTEKNARIKQMRLRTVAFVLLGLILVLLALLWAQSRTLVTKTRSMDLLNQRLQDAFFEKEVADQAVDGQKKRVADLLKLNQRTLFTKDLKLSTLADSLGSVGAELNKLASSEGIVRPGDLAEIKRKVADIMASNNDIWKDFKTQFEEIKPGFFKKLKLKCPDLSINDLKHASYIASNLRTKDVAKLINVSPRSVETARYRIKKKLGLEAEQSLYDFIQQI